MLNIFEYFVVLWIVSYLRKGIKASPVSSPHNVFTKTIRMPTAISDKADSLLCHAAKLDPDEHYILRYEPHATKKVAHHMMVYGCGLPGSDKPYWSCASMDDHSNKSVCADGERQIIWAWAMDADGRKFPEGVGFRIGGNTKIHYIVIQLHYAKKFAPGKTDRSGVTLYMTHKPQPLQAGYYVLYTYGYVPPMVKEYHIESACTYNNNYTIYPIAYRTHSHNLGVVTSGYRVRNGTWTEIGRMSPQLPQTFYDVTTPGIEIKSNDILTYVTMKVPTLRRWILFCGIWLSLSLIWECRSSAFPDGSRCYVGSKLLTSDPSLARSVKGWLACLPIADSIADIQLQNFSGSNTDGSCTRAVSNSFLNPWKKSPACRFRII